MTIIETYYKSASLETIQQHWHTFSDSDNNNNRIIYLIFI